MMVWSIPAHPVPSSKPYLWDLESIWKLWIRLYGAINNNIWWLSFSMVGSCVNEGFFSDGEANQPFWLLYCLLGFNPDRQKISHLCRRENGVDDKCFVQTGWITDCSNGMKNRVSRIMQDIIKPLQRFSTRSGICDRQTSNVSAKDNRWRYQWTASINLVWSTHKTLQGNSAPWVPESIIHLR